MKNFLLGSMMLTALVSASPAVAAHDRNDWTDWSGAFAGVNAGYGLGSNHTGFDPLPTAASFFNLKPVSLKTDPDGFIVGPHAGYNWQKDKLVFGAVADFSFTSIAGKASEQPIVQNDGTPFPGAGFLTTSQHTDWLSTLRGRVGYTPCPHGLLYLTGGLALGQEHYNAITNFRPTGTTIYTEDTTRTQLGWTAGAGAEYDLGHNWSVKAEYLYYDLGDKSFTVDPTPALPPFQMRYNFKTGTNVARIGFSYKFDSL